MQHWRDARQLLQLLIKPVLHLINMNKRSSTASNVPAITKSLQATPRPARTAKILLFSSTVSQPSKSPRAAKCAPLCWPSSYSSWNCKQKLANRGRSSSWTMCFLNWMPLVKSCSKRPSNIINSWSPPPTPATRGMIA